MGFVRKTFGVDLTGNQAVRRAASAQQQGIAAATDTLQGAFGEARGMLEAQAAPFAGISQQLVDFQDPQAQAEFAMNNPLLRFMADEAQRRVFSSQAARGKLGSTATATSLQNALVEQGMNAVQQRQASLFGLSQLGMQQQNNVANLISGHAANIANLQTGSANVNAASLMAQQRNTGAITGQVLGAGIGALTGGIGGALTGQGFAQGAGAALMGGTR